MSLPMKPSTTSLVRIALLLALSACSSRTEIVVGVATDLTTPTTLDALKKMLAAAIAAKPEQAITLSADKSLPYGEVAELLDAVRSAGIKKVGLEVQRK